MKVLIKREVAGTLLAMAREAHPREFIALLRGKRKKGVVTLSEVIIAPIATMGYDFASFRFDMMPIDLSIVGSAHSHPSGSWIPSPEDVNNMVGVVMLIVSYPYRDEMDIRAYDKEGNPVNFDIID